MKVWVITSIGCIECGSENEEPVVGVYTSKEAADAQLEVERAELDAWVRDCHERGYSHLRYEEEHGGFSGPDFQIRCQEIELTGAENSNRGA